MLHIVNGSCAVRALQKAGIPGEFLPWDDLLYEGPVPFPGPLDRLSAVRARFVSDAGWESFAGAGRHFRRRDRCLMDLDRHDEVILWNSLELTDQLQLLQLLYCFSALKPGNTGVRIIYLNDYLAEDAVSLIECCWGTQRAVRQAEFSEAASLWSAFCSETPLELYRLSRAPGRTHALRFLEAALERLFQEFPSLRDGLSRTQRQILLAVQEGPMAPLEIFRYSQSKERRRFIGDWSFWRQIESLASVPEPLIESRHGGWKPFEPLRRASHAGFYQSRLVLTAKGRKVFAGELDALDLIGIDRWIGGVHLIPGNVWRWCDESGRFYEPGA